MSKPRDGTVGVGLLGFGTVGSEVFRLLTDHRDLVLARTGIPIVVEKVAVADPLRSGPRPLPSRLRRPWRVCSGKRLPAPSATTGRSW